MTALIKIGGALLDSAEARTRLAAEIGRAVENGLNAIVVHGGGKQMTRFLAERNVESRFVNGLRVTTPEVLDAVLKVFAGSVNQELVAAFVAAGVRAVGLTGMDALLTEARQMSEALGYVGQPVRSDAALLNLLTGNSYLPVVACVAGDRQGRFYNVNADQMAASLAAAIQPEKILFLTDVEGVRGESDSVYSTLAPFQCRELIDSGVVTGGMRAKIEAAMAALEAGIGEIVIARGDVEGVVGKFIANEPIGTRLVAEAGVRSDAS